MIYHTVTITQVMDEWVVEFKDGSDVDRVEADTVPSPTGYYHFPSTESKKDALAKLAICMLDAHKAEMVRLGRSMRKLIDAAAKMEEEGRL